MFRRKRRADDDGGEPVPYSTTTAPSFLQGMTGSFYIEQALPLMGSMPGGPAGPG